jgi:hypothetical protein
VKSVFLNDVKQEEVFVKQPLDFENPKYPNRVYKLSKACMGLSKHRGHDMLGLKLFC